MILDTEILTYITNLPNSKTMCLLCNECVSAVKESNFKLHFITKHWGFLNFVPGSSFG